MEIVATTQEHKIPEGRVLLLGAMDQVTGAMTLIEQPGGQSLLIDCGSPIGKVAEDWLLPSEAIGAEALLLTHGHTDHVSGLADLLAAGFRKPIYGTFATLELTRLNMRDGLRLQGESNGAIRSFLKSFNRLAKEIKYNQTVDELGDFAGQAVFREAGHIMGSASIDITTPNARVLCSGDLGRPDSPILEDYNTTYPDGPPIDLLVMESTYGNREHKTHSKEVEEELEHAIKHALRDGGHILVPAFAIGRTQTLLYHLNTLVESGRIEDLPVALDSPMGIKVTELYSESRELFDEEARALLSRGDDPLEFEDLYAVNRHKHSVQLRDVPDPMLIIAGSGMCTGGRIVGHLQELLPVKETCVLFVGYQAAGTPGRAIQEAARTQGTVRIGREEVVVRAEIKTMSGLSAHADRQELKAWLDAVPTPKRVALHHGEASVQHDFARWLGQFY